MDQNVEENNTERIGKEGIVRVRLTKTTLFKCTNEFSKTNI